MSHPYLLSLLRRLKCLPETFPDLQCTTLSEEESLIQRWVERGELNWNTLWDALEGALGIPWWREALPPLSFLSELMPEAGDALDCDLPAWRGSEGKIHVLFKHPSQWVEFQDLSIPTIKNCRCFLILPSREQQHAAQVQDPAGLYERQRQKTSRPVSYEDPLQQLIDRAAQQDASDIHLEPFPAEQGGRIRLRVDGCLREELTVESQAWRWLLGSIQKYASLPVDERHNPHDANLQVPVQSGEVKLRLSWIPSVNGPAVVMRRLPDLSDALAVRPLDDMSAELSEQWRGLLQQSQGILLVAGPTGSGKSTTMRQCLQWRDPRRHKIIAIEDPVEVCLPGVQHIKVDTEKGRTFAKVLQACLRQSPDLIFIGEIRDEETAAAVVEAALTGHMIVSTIHANSGPAACLRLQDLGVDLLLLKGLLKGVLSQRLLRKRCLNCRPGHHCHHCQASGYRGRRAVFDFYNPLQPATNQPFEQARTQAKSEGWTDMEEIQRVLD